MFVFLFLSYSNTEKVRGRTVQSRSDQVRDICGDKTARTDVGTYTAN